MNEVQAALTSFLHRYDSKIREAQAAMSNATDPADIAKAAIDLTFWNAAWNTIVEVAGELKISLRNDHE